MLSKNDDKISLCEAEKDVGIIRDGHKYAVIMIVRTIPTYNIIIRLTELQEIINQRIIVCSLKDAAKSDQVNF
ncbi:MAG: hypothetical protein JSC189_000932 [Candidatus Tokpelaia sp. JSC189]|nr:MAG: hypothetical protein JSC189_000932 [Candidatus Tokpelaia sp. JSC189]